MSASRLVALAATLSLVTAHAFAKTDGFVRITVRVTPHVHLIQRPIATNAPYEGNVEVIEQSDGLVVVDAGVYVVSAIRKLSRKPVKFLIYTHYHGDHNLGAGAFLKAWPHLVIVSTEATRTSMTGKPMDYIKTYSKDYAGAIAFWKKRLEGSELTPAGRAGAQQMVDAGDSIVAGYRNMRAYPATLTFTDKLTIPDSETPVEMMFLGRANTDGDAVIWVPSEKVMITGDIVVNPIPYAAASYPTSWLGVFDRIEAYDFAYLIPGHGDIETGYDYLDKVKDTLRQVQAQVVPLAQKGVPLDDVYKQTDFKALTASYAGDNRWLANAFDSFFLHSLIKNVYFEATGQPIVQGTY